jgi:hypothetical protein
MVVCAQDNEMLTGLASNLIPKGIDIMQYTDDTVMCLAHDLEKS